MLRGIYSVKLKIPLMVRHTMFLNVPDAKMLPVVLGLVSNYKTHTGFIILAVKNVYLFN